MGRLSEQHPELGDGGCEAEVGIQTLHGSAQRLLEQLARPPRGRLIARLHVQYLAGEGTGPRRRWRRLEPQRVQLRAARPECGGDQLVQGRDAAASSQLASVLAVVVEVTVLELAVLVADQPNASVGLNSSCSFTSLATVTRVAVACSSNTFCASARSSM